jgi:hypothetical protein
MKRKKSQPEFVLCICNDDCDDLEVRKVYQVLPDPAAAQEGYLRVIDESGEDYLYPADYFVTVELPAAVAKTLALSA